MGVNLHIHTVLYSLVSELTKTTADTWKTGCDTGLDWQWFINFNKCILTKVTLTVGSSKLIQRQLGMRRGQKRREIIKCNILNSGNFRSLTGIWCLDFELISFCVLWLKSPGTVVKIYIYILQKIANGLWNDTIKWWQWVKRRVVEMKGRDYIWTSVCTEPA